MSEFNTAKAVLNVVAVLGWIVVVAAIILGLATAQDNILAAVSGAGALAVRAHWSASPVRTFNRDCSAALQRTRRM